MVVVKMLLAGAITKNVTTLVTISVWNTGVGTATNGVYGYEIRGKKDKLMKQGQVEYKRKAEHAIKLLQKVINDAYPEFST